MNATEKQALKLYKAYESAYLNCMSENTMKNRYLKFSAYCKANNINPKEFALAQM